MSRQIWDPKQPLINYKTREKVKEARQKAIEELNIKSGILIYIYNLNTGEHLNFPLVPDTLVDTHKPVFHTESGIYGRTTPLYFYTGGSEKTLSFNFTLHEDLLDRTTDDLSIRNNLYKFLKKLQSFTKPHYVNIGSETQTFKEPQVYLQIGDHFAGKGFIEVNWSQRVPFRNDRYILADVSIKFNYNIEYEQIEKSFFRTDIEEVELYRSTEEFTIDLDYFDEDTFENFIPEYLSYDYIRSHTYENLRELELSKINSSLVSKAWHAMRFLQVGGETKFLITLPPDIYYDYDTHKYIDPRAEDLTNVFISALYSLYEDLTLTVHPSINIIYKHENLKELRRAAVQVNTAYRVSGGTILVEYVTVRGTGNSPTNRTPFKMSKKDKELFEREYKKLLSIIDTQIAVISGSIEGGASQ